VCVCGMQESDDEKGESSDTECEYSSNSLLHYFF